MAKGKTGLGRGLGALIPALAPSVETVDVERIVSNPHQPRTAMEPEALAELAESIRQHGVIQPLLVSQVEAAGGGVPTYQIIAGERRLQAARLAGLSRVPVVLKEATPREIAARVGKSRTAVANSLRLLGLSDEMKASLAGGEITSGHARALLGLHSPRDRHQAWRRLVQRGLSVRETEELVRSWPGAARQARPAPRRDPEIEALEERLRSALGTKVRLAKGRRGGRITVYFYSDEELESFLDRLASS
jgi:ParB family chromosome partitioning protein